MPQRPPIPPSVPPAAKAWFVELARPSATAWRQVAEHGVGVEELGGGPIGLLLAATLAECSEPEDDEQKRRRAERDTAALARWRDERAAGKPLAFARLVLEVTRRKALDEALEDPVATWAALLDMLDHPALRTTAEARQRDLIALANAYLADEYRLLGDHYRAEQYLAATRRVVDGGHDPEVRASILELRAELHNDREDLAGCQDDLDSALTLLGAPHHETYGRTAQTLYRCGRLAYRRHDFEKASMFLRLALEALSDGLDLRLRVDVLHLLAFCSACLGDDAAAFGHLEVIDGLPATYDTTRLLGQRHWLRGRLAAREGRLDEAAKALRVATSALTEAGLPLEGLRAFTALADVVDRQGRLREARGALRELFHATFRPEHFTHVRHLDLDRLDAASEIELWREIDELLARAPETVQ